MATETAYVLALWIDPDLFTVTKEGPVDTKDGPLHPSEDSFADVRTFDVDVDDDEIHIDIKTAGDVLLEELSDAVGEVLDKVTVGGSGEVTGLCIRVRVDADTMSEIIKSGLLPMLTSVDDTDIDLLGISTEVVEISKPKPITLIPVKTEPNELADLLL